MKKLMTSAVVAAAIALPAMAMAKESVILSMRLEPPGLDPTTGAAAAISQITLYNIFETLTRLDNSGAVHPLLAKSWSISDDGLTYTFNLHSGVKFHDGADLTAEDVKFIFERNAAKDSRNKKKKVFRNMASVSAKGPHTVAIQLKSTNGLLTFLLAQATAVVVDPASAPKNETNPVGSGPYKFVKWTKGDSVELTKFAGHRDAGGVAIKDATFRFISDNTAQVAALLSGDIDYAPGLGACELFPQFENNDKFTTLKGNTEGETILSMNNKSKALSDVRVRKAVMHAIDRKAVIDAASCGYGTPIGTHFAPHHPAYLDLTAQSAYDPAKAKALLAEAGYGGGLELSLKLPPVGYARRGGEVIADYLRRVGITAKIQNVEWAVWLDQVYKNKQYDLSIVSHVEPLDIGIYARKKYYFQYDNAEFNNLIKMADSATNQADRYKYWQLAQRKLADDQVNGFLFELPKLGVAKKGLKGMWNNWPAFINYLAEYSWE